MLIVGNYHLLADAKIPKYVPKDFVGGDFAEDGAEVVEGFADVLGGEVGGEAGGESVLGALEGGAGVGEGLVVAGVGDKSCVAVAKPVFAVGG